ncbi:filamentous hemagglutinin family protein [Xanthomonas axonopodis pv. poinsettiicola]|uniref:filamentous haemagglutinin family protein n=1 Tax=Xanthomonas TaxID=338 RepID=UPI001E370FCB|nr:filamentous haemagglutinin family protein [Xanthomonas codiaei]MCC8539489.1 filamentous hemagglutinin family protein [Xanthomonas codiaei]
MTRKRRSRPLRVFLLSAAISTVLLDQAYAQSSPFVRRGADPSAQAAQAAQQQGVQAAAAGQLAQKSLQAFQRAAQARQALDATQAAARAAAAVAQASAVPDGLVRGGLQLPDNLQVDPGSVRAGDPRLGQRNIWLGARAPTQQVSDGTTQVTVTQTQKKAILNWETFNVGSRTQLRFDQSAGGSDAAQWIALNRVNDPGAAPSRILGSIQAPGQVYLLNRNGVLFGAGSQVNAHSLLVSSLDLFDPNRALSDQTFLNRGLFGATGQSGVVLTGIDAASAGSMPGDIRIESGARLASGSQGYTLIAAPNVSNAGSVGAQDGQALLAAVLGLRQSQELQQLLGSSGTIAPLGFGAFGTPSGSDLSGVGTLDNSGSVVATRGNASLVGYNVQQRGLVQASTSISRPGSVMLLALGQDNQIGENTLAGYKGGALTLAPGSVTTILPERDGETSTSSAASDLAFVGPKMVLAGAQMQLQSQSLTFAPGGTLDMLSLAAETGQANLRGRSALNNRLMLDSGAQVNVSGIANVQQRMQDNLVRIPRVGLNELADAPLQRNGVLFRQSLQFDRRASGVRDDGQAWVGSPLLNAQGYVDQVPRAIDELLQDGGSINIAARDLVIAPGAQLDLDGGYVHTQGGMVETARLLGADGRLHDLASADPNLQYLGIAGSQSVQHSRWGVTEQFANPLLGSRRYFESEYLQGGDGGALNIALGRELNSSGVAVLAGSVSAQAIPGRYQRASGQMPQGGTLSINSDAALYNSTLGQTNGTPRDPRSWQIVSTAIEMPQGLQIDTPSTALPGSAGTAQQRDNPLFWSQLSTRMLDGSGLHDVSIGNAPVIAVEADAQLQVTDGGRIALQGQRVEIDGGLSARAGTIAVQSGGGVVRPQDWRPGAMEAPERGDLLLGSAARLDVSGRWVNDDRRLTLDPVGRAFVDGGSITLDALQQALGDADNPTGRDVSASLLISPGAVLDASGGGYVAPDGTLTLRDGRPLGHGGDIALHTYQRPPGDNAASPTYTADLPVADNAGRLQFDPASLHADSFAGGGTLSLRAYGVQIGGQTPGDARVLHLDGDFFANGSFGAYALAAEHDATIVAGTQVRVSQRSLIPDLQALGGAPSDRAVTSGAAQPGGNGYARLGQLDPFYRPAADFSLRGGDFIGRVAGNPSLDSATGQTVLDTGAHLLLDAGANVRLGGRGQVTVLGEIQAHGGSIAISGDTSSTSGLSPSPDTNANQPYALPGKSVWLGERSRLDVSGIALLDPQAAWRPSAAGLVQPRSGRVLDGGRITLSNDSGAVVVAAGAQLDLRGSAAELDLPSGSPVIGAGDPLQAQTVGSAGGALQLAAATGLFFDGSIRAAGGTALDRGGSLSLQPLQLQSGNGLLLPGPSGVIFTQHDSRLPQGAQPGVPLTEPNAAPGPLYFAADRLSGSGIDTLAVGDQTPDETQPLVPIGFAGDVALSVSRALLFNAPSYALLRGDAQDFSALADSSRVALSATYVGLNGYRPQRAGDIRLTEPRAGGDTTLQVQAQQIDVGGQVALDGVGTAVLSSTGALRFHTPVAYAYAQTANGAAIPRAGELLTAGDLTLRAAQIYPGSGETFLVRALGAATADGGRADTRIQLQAQGEVPAVPLSAGGTLALDATSIVQQGRLRAPGGRLLLGVADRSDGAADPVFGDRATTPTREVRLADGSLTSVSLEGAVMPYGTTVDGNQWRYDGTPQGTSPALTAPPQKQIRVQGEAVALDAGARVDLSGGGDLLASEWVPGTGGSRDLLSSSNTSYASGTATQLPLYPDGRSVYAIVPGVQSLLAASDASVERNGGAPALGSAVQLDGVPGLAAGTYTLLPARYATLPGALRVVVRPDSVDATSALNLVAPDGSAVVAGHFVDTLSGTRSARSQLFEVQSAATWGQYSEYTSTSATAFFGSRPGVTQLPRDGGQLILAAGDRLDLGATLSTAAAGGGNAAQVDIAARALQVLGAGQAAASGYVGIEAGALNALNAGSLLLGGVREQTADGTRVHVSAQTVRVSNTADSALRAPELLLTAAGSTQDGGVRIDAGSVLQAQGGSGTRAGAPLLFGSAGGESGDGALLRLSSVGAASVQRANVPDAAQSQAMLQIGDGARLDGGAALTLDSTGASAIAAGAVLRGERIDASAGEVRLDAQAANGDANGLVLGLASLAQFAQARDISLHSYGDMRFAGGLDLRVDNALTLSAARFVGDGRDVGLRADRLTLSNLGAAAAGVGAGAGDALAGSGLLHLQGREVAFAGGEKRLAGFGAVAVDAIQQVLVRDRGQFDFGAVDVDLRTPLLQADAGADQALITQGALRLQRTAGSIAGTGALGGRITLQGGSIDSTALIRANSGAIQLRGTKADVRLHDGASLDAAGIANVFFDRVQATPGGSITLDAAQGDVIADASTRLDVRASGTTNAGTLALSAKQGSITLAGAIDAGAAQGQGGRFTLDSGTAVALDPLSVQLAAGGFTGSVDVHARSGNLVLSADRTLRAASVSLTADGGAAAASRDAQNGTVRIDGRIDASGSQGGSIALWGRHGVEINGQLLARGSAADKRGGSIQLGSSGMADGTLNPDFGYQNVQAAAAGAIAIGAAAVLDVSGGSAGGLSGGDVQLRTPLLNDGEVNVTVADGASIRGAREVGLEAYAVWSTTDASSDPAKHFDGIVDPAGWYDAQGNLLAGSWSDLAGNPVTTAPTTPAQIADYLSRYVFTPDSANLAHRQFYGYADDATGTPGTLMGFVQRPGFRFEQRLATVPNLRARPGIELRNPDPGINGGEIRVLSNWNLGAGANRNQLDFRYDGTAPVVSLRADSGVIIKASLSDGFYQLSNPFGGGGPQATYPTAQAGYQAVLAFGQDQLFASLDGLVPAPPSSLGGDQEQAAQYYGQYLQLLDMLQKPQAELSSSLPPYDTLLGGFIGNYSPDLAWPVQDYPGQPSAPGAPTSPADYPQYLRNYERYVLDLSAFYTALGEYPLPTFTPPSLPVLGALLPAATQNTPSLQVNANNPLPSATTSLIGGDSSSYRIVAGADFAGIRPDGLRAGSTADVVLDGHQRYQQAGSKDLLLPNVVRTGTGSILIAAARDLQLADADAPASIYSAGRPAAGSEVGTNVTFVRSGDSQSGGSVSRAADQIVSAQANAEAAGDIQLQAGRDILGNRQIYDRDGSRTGLVDNYVGQYWWPWLQVGNPVGADGATPRAGLINYGGFAQGVLSSGGDVAVQAGRDIRELSVSLPTSYVLTADGRQTYAGGDLDVAAGRDVLGGDYFVARGQGSLSAGGNLGSAFSLSAQGFDIGGTQRQVSSAIDPILALQEGQWSVHAGGDAALGAIVNPSYLNASGTIGPLLGDSTRATTDYGQASSVTIDALQGDVRLGTLKLPGLLFFHGQRDRGRDTDSVFLTDGVFDSVLPAQLSATAHAGAIQLENSGRLFPSAQGQLELLAQGDIRLFDNTFTNDKRKFDLAMLDEAGAYAGEDIAAAATDKLNLHRDDTQPVRLYSRDGDLVGGYALDGFMVNPLTLKLPKQADIRAGGDIVNLDLRAQNYRLTDVTRVQAGRDLYYTPVQGGPDQGEVVRWGWLELAGPGTFEVQAGRNLGPLTSANEALSARLLNDRNAGGIRTTGNRSNTGLPGDGADLVVRYGVANGEDADALAAQYLDPASAQSTATYQQWLLAFTRLHATDAPAAGTPAIAAAERALATPPASLSTPAEAWQAFSQLPASTRRLLTERVFLDVLKQVGEGYATPSSADFQKYARGYAAIDLLFPSRLGYTRNNLDGGANGASVRNLTGTLDMRGSTLQTERGGDIRVLGPGGGLQIGSVLAPPTVVDGQGNVLIGPAQQGILAVGRGDVGIFTDASVLLAQSRIFTQRGGDLTVWSSNGDINAGKGSKTSAERSRARYLCDQDQFCMLDASGQVSGAGIATLQLTADDPRGNAVLVAPRGTVDAGDAGIRVAGNLVVASQFVANADNIQVQGDTVGVGTTRSVNTSALSSASNAAAAVADAANDVAKRPPTVNDTPSVITVQVVGFGECADNDQRCRPGP